MKRSLIIQEDIILMRILEHMMMSHSYDCRAIQSLTDLEIEDQNINFDIIISDILFDGIAPLDFVFQIKEIILHNSLIIVTNMGQDKIEAEILATRNVVGFFAVPFDMGHIEKLII